MFLGIDIGTSAVKVVAVDANDQAVANAEVALTVERPGPLMSEQDPHAWWAATQQAVRALPDDVRLAVRAVGLSGQMHGATLLDNTGAVLRPAILWNDGRAGAECAELEAAVPDLGRIAGNRAMPGFTAPKLLWLRRHEPEAFARVAKILLPKDYVRFRMTGDYASDMSDSAGTLWLDVAERRWSDTVLDVCGLSKRQMPDVHEGSQQTGVLRKEIAQAWGMDPVPVAAGGGDNAAGAVGSGVVRPGEAFLSLGTSGVLFLANDRFRPNPAGGVHCFCHALPGRWHQMSVLLSAASAVDWVAGVTGFPSPAALYAAAEHQDTPAATELFLPYLTGERTPHNDPYAQGVFLGLTANSDRLALARAALEGVAFAFADGLDALTDTGAALETIAVIGGGARSALWGRILSAALDRPLTYRTGGEFGPAFGAARLARLALTNEDPEDICAAPPVRAVIAPDDALRDLYAKRRPIFQQAYRQLKPLFQENRA